MPRVVGANKGQVAETRMEGRNRGKKGGARANDERIIGQFARVCDLLTLRWNFNLCARWRLEFSGAAIGYYFFGMFFN